MFILTNTGYDSACWIPVPIKMQKVPPYLLPDCLPSLSAYISEKANSFYGQFLLGLEIFNSTLSKHVPSKIRMFD
jgi:hypothetical protein